MAVGLNPPVGSSPLARRRRDGMSMVPNTSYGNLHDKQAGELGLFTATGSPVHTQDLMMMKEIMSTNPSKTITRSQTYNTFGVERHSPWELPFDAPRPRTPAATPETSHKPPNAMAFHPLGMTSDLAYEIKGTHYNFLMPGFNKKINYAVSKLEKQRGSEDTLEKWSMPRCEKKSEAAGVYQDMRTAFRAIRTMDHPQPQSRSFATSGESLRYSEPTQVPRAVGSDNVSGSLKSCASSRSTPAIAGQAELLETRSLSRLERIDDATSTNQTTDFGENLKRARPRLSRPLSCTQPGPSRAAVPSSGKDAGRSRTSRPSSGKDGAFGGTSTPQSGKEAGSRRGFGFPSERETLSRPSRPSSGVTIGLRRSRPNSGVLAHDYMQERTSTPKSIVPELMDVLSNASAVPDGS